MNKHKTLIFSTAVCLLPIALFFAFYQRFPEQMAVHWGVDGAPNGYASKIAAGVWLPLFLAVTNLFVNVVLDHDPKKQNASPFLISLGKWCVPVISVFTMTATFMWNLNYKFPIDKMIFILLGVMFVAIGIGMPKCKQNYTVGIKLPWTLNSEENWNKTHKLAGKVWVICGAVMLLGCLIPMNAFVYILFADIAVMVIAPCVYSFILYKKGI